MEAMMSITRKIGITFILIALLSPAIQARTLKLTTQQKVISLTEEDCVEASDECLLAITPGEPSLSKKQYKVEQICGVMLNVDLRLQIDEQARERRFLANKFCHGKTMLSSMKIPKEIHRTGEFKFNLNDGRLLLITMIKTINQLIADSNEMIQLAKDEITANINGCGGRNSQFASLRTSMERLLQVSVYANTNIYSGGEIILTRNPEKQKFSIKCPDFYLFFARTTENNLCSINNSYTALRDTQQWNNQLAELVKNFESELTDIIDAMKSEEIITNIDLTHPIWKVDFHKPNQPEQKNAYLDPLTSTLTISSDDCFWATAFSTFKIDENRLLTQELLRDNELAQTIDKTPTAAVKICNSQSFYSKLRDPRLDIFEPIQDIRSLNLLNMTLKNDLIEMEKQLQAMLYLTGLASSGLYTSDELKKMDDVYQIKLQDLAIFSRSKKFNRIHILDSDISLNIPVNHGKEYLQLQLYRFDNESLGLTWSDITTISNAEITLDALKNSIIQITTQLDTVDDLQVEINKFIKREESWVVSDI